jgi:hypothetical protein
MKKLICLAALIAAGCTHAGRQYHSREYQQRPSLNASLVKDERAMLSEEAIRMLLESRIKIPDRVKLAVLPLGHFGTHGEERGWGAYGYSREVEFPQERKAYLEALEHPLSATGRFTEITHVPAMMLPAEPSLTRLREAAALMQAELLLVYSTRSHLVTWRGIFHIAKDEVRALSSIELILVDVRTGVVPYAETFDAELLVKEGSEDLSLAETQRRAERQATLRAMGRAAEGLKKFMAP